MPKLDLALKRTSNNGSEPIRVLLLSGYIDAANYAGFEKALEILLRNRVRNLVLDFTGVEYVNSSGISTVIRYAQDFEGAGGEMVLAGVSREVGVTMHLLGLTAVVPILRDVPAAVRYFRSAGREGKRAGFFNYLLEKFRTDPTSRIRYRLPFRKRPPAGKTKDAAVLMIVPEADVFSDVIRLRLFDPSGKFDVVCSTREALGRLDALNPDLIILDDRVEGSEEFLAEVKTRKKRSLTSVLKLYGKDRTPKALRQFKIWENDFLVEPFEIRQLFHLAEAELKRVPKDRKVFLHQVRFQFGSSRANVERAQALAKNLIAQAGFTGDHATMMVSAFNEAVDNAVHHGNRGDAAKTVSVMFLIQDDRLVLMVEDEGAGFHAGPYLSRAAKTPAADLARRAKQTGGRGGLGIALMKRCTDKIKYLGKCNIVRLEKKIR